MALGGPFRAWTSWEPLGCHESVRCRSEMTGGLRAYVRACVRVRVFAAVSEALNVFAPAPLHRCH